MRVSASLRPRAAFALAGALALAFASGCGGPPPPRPLPVFQAPAADLGPRTLRLDEAASSLVVEVPPSGVLAGLGHTHAEVVKRWGGVVSFDPAHPEATRGIVHAAVGSVRDETTTLAEDTRKKLDEETLGEGILDAAKHPRATFELERLLNVTPASAPADARTLGRALEPDGAAHALVAHLRGTLTLHGEAHVVEGPVAASWSSGGVRVVGYFPLRLSQFGIARHAKLLGALGNRDVVIVRFDFVARPAAASPAGAPR